MTILAAWFTLLIILSCSCAAYLYGKRDEDCVWINVNDREPPVWGTYHVFGEVQIGEQKTNIKYYAHWHDDHWTDRQGNRLSESDRYNSITHWLDTINLKQPKTKTIF